MIEQLATALRAYSDRQTGESPYLTAIEGVGILRSDRPKPPTHLLMQPAICIVAQGAKRATFGHEQLTYRAGQALVVGIDAPSVGHVLEASLDAPCMVLAFELNLATMRDVAESLSPLPAPRGRPGRGVFVADATGPLTDCALRLLRLLATPDAIPTLYPLIQREVCYWLLAGPHGGEVARLALAHGPASTGVVTAIQHLRQHYREPLSIADLALRAHLSPSAFHRQFKALTCLSPLQYQKQLRLLEARRMLQTGKVNVEAAAYGVGYESPSQFSREYARMYGKTPARDRRAAVV